MSKPKWDTRRKGRTWTKDECYECFEFFPEKNEMFSGQHSWSQEERENVLGLLLELVGADRAVRIGSSSVWRSAIADLSKKRS